MFIVLLNLPLSFSRSMKNAVSTTLSPMQEVGSGSMKRLKNGANALRGWGGLAEENQKLEEENSYLQMRIKELEFLESENTRLSRDLKFSERTERSLVAAKVIGRDVSGWWHTIRVNRGRRDGIQENQAVITPQGLVGKVKTVHTRNCDILLVSDPSLHVHSVIPRHDAYGVVKGREVAWRGGRRCDLSLINKDTRIYKYDEIVSSGMGTVFPKGITIGYVEKIEMDSSRLYQNAVIRPAVDLSALSTVFIVKQTTVEANDVITGVGANAPPPARSGPVVHGTTVRPANLSGGDANGPSEGDTSP